MAMILLLTLVMPVRFGQNKEVFSDNSTNKKKYRQNINAFRLLSCEIPNRCIHTKITVSCGLNNLDIFN